MTEENQQKASDEIKLTDMVNFFKRNQRQIVFFGLAGLLLSTAYVLLTPKKYEARWQMQIAQLANVNIEEPAALIQRLRISSSYPGAVRRSCGMPEDGDFGDYLGGALVPQAIPNLPAAVEMKFRAPSVMQAKQCAEAIVPMIMAQQHDFIEDRLSGRKPQLMQYQQTLREEMQQLEQKKNLELGIATYLTRHDQLSWLRGRIDVLREETLLSQLHPAKLTAPIFVSKNPVSPRVGLVLLLGLSLGLMVGVLYSLGREEWCRASRRGSLDAE